MRPLGAVAMAGGAPARARRPGAGRPAGPRGGLASAGIRTPAAEQGRARGLGRRRSMGGGVHGGLGGGAAAQAATGRGGCEAGRRDGQSGRADPVHVVARRWAA